MVMSITEKLLASAEVILKNDVNNLGYFYGLRSWDKTWEG